MLRVKESDWKLVEERIKKMNSTLKLAILGEIYTKEDMIQQVKNRTEVGKIICEIELEYINFSLKR